MNPAMICVFTGIFDLIHPDDRARVRGMHEDIPFEEAARREFEFKGICTNGRVKTIAVRKKDPSGEGHRGGPWRFSPQTLFSPGPAHEGPRGAGPAGLRSVEQEDGTTRSKWDNGDPDRSFEFVAAARMEQGVVVFDAVTGYTHPETVCRQRPGKPRTTPLHAGPEKGPSWAFSMLLLSRKRPGPQGGRPRRR